jgi:DNA replication ATP-dependent helicase Dna2
MSSKTVYRFLIVDQTKDDNRRQIHLKLKPIVRNEDSKESYDCLVTGIWFDCSLKVNQIIHIIEPKFDKHFNTFIVNNEFGFIIIFPDLLISSTTLMSANYCMRKSWLSTKFSGWSQPNKSMLVGNIVHQLFQDSCRQRLKGIDRISELFSSIFDNFIDDCYAIGVNRSQIEKDVSIYIPSIAKWLDNYIHSISSFDDKESDKYSNISDNDIKLQALKVRDIEDNIWSTKLGLKGKVDVTLDVVIHERQTKRKQTVPLELKTGKASFSNEHSGQVSLYSIMMEDRTQTNEGLLLYLKDGPLMRQIITKRPVKRDLLQLRNELVNHLNNIDIGPKPKNNYRICSQCDHLFDCALTLQTLETENLTHSEIMSKELIPQVISHLSNADLDFFKKWISLLHLELTHVNERDFDSKLGFWNESSNIRESKGLGFAKLTLFEQTDGSAVFIRNHKFFESLGNFNLSNNVMRQWERVALSIDVINTPKKNEIFQNNCKQIAIALGFIKSIDSEQIELVLDKKLESTHKNSIFRIDHLSSNNLLTTNFTNLLRLMDSSSVQSERLRKLIIGQKVVSHTQQFQRKIVTKGRHILKPLNEHQQRAVLKALSTDSYILLRGMPGAGKTQTIVALVRLLVALEQSVLITSYTHAAVDNILLKLKSHNIEFLRIGSEKRVHRDLHSYTVAMKTSNLKTIEELENYYSSVRVVASTCLGVSSHPIFNRRSFDYCIIDEASQVLLPTCLGPLFHGNRFMLVGDHKQLPPVVQSESAKLLGLDQSLFVILQNETNITDLTIQYRMNEEIMRIANQLTYDGVLKCGSTDISSATLTAMDHSYLDRNDWIAEVMRTDLSNSVIFLDTDEIPAEEIRDSNGKVCNEIEVKIVQSIVQNLLKYFKLTVNDIGVISPYQRQVRLLKEMICINNIEINTVDQYQGRDKDVIIYSCVRSKSHDSNACDSSRAEILCDERRLNVAITRAKKKLIIIGSKTTLIKYNPFYRLISILRLDQILSIPKSDFHLIHF